MAPLEREKIKDALVPKKIGSFESRGRTGALLGGFRRFSELGTSNAWERGIRKIEG